MMLWGWNSWNPQDSSFYFYSPAAAPVQTCKLDSLSSPRLSHRKKVHTLAMTAVSFHQIEFTFDRRVMSTILNDCRELLHQAIKRHLTAKSHSRVNHVFNHFSDCDFLAALYGPSEIYRAHLQKICNGVNKMLDEGSLWPSASPRHQIPLPLVTIRLFSFVLFCFCMFPHFTCLFFVGDSREHLYLCVPFSLIVTLNSLRHVTPKTLFLYSKRNTTQHMSLSLSLDECKTLCSYQYIQGKVPWQLCLGRKIYFYLQSKGSIFALILNQKNVNPGTGLWCMMLLMDKNVSGTTRRWKTCASSFLWTPKGMFISLFFSFF